jgi:hypothetical protein
VLLDWLRQVARRWRKHKNESHQVWAESLNTDQIKERFGALGAAINGPKLWEEQFPSRSASTNP